jgi:hypothetical protein
MSFMMGNGKVGVTGVWEGPLLTESGHRSMAGGQAARSLAVTKNLKLPEADIH